jgi:hypothetical protein
LTTSGEWAITTGMTRLDATTGSSQSTVMFRGPVLNVVEVDVPLAHQSIQSGVGKKMVGMVDDNNNVRTTLFYPRLPICLSCHNPYRYTSSRITTKLLSPLITFQPRLLSYSMLAHPPNVLWKVASSPHGNYHLPSPMIQTMWHPPQCGLLIRYGGQPLLLARMLLGQSEVRLLLPESPPPVTDAYWVTAARCTSTRICT